MQLVLDLLVPGIIAGVSCYGMAKRVDVYDALLQGAAKGLEILLRILPALVTLLTVVAMLRASGALELAAELLAPALEWLGIPPETVGLMLVRPISGSAALGVGSELHYHLWPGLHHWAHGSGDAGLHRDHLLYHCGVFRRSGDQENPVCGAGGPLCRFGGLFLCLPYGAAVFGITVGSEMGRAGLQGVGCVL